MKLYNTLTRQKEEFIPLTSDLVRIYSCGPTVYSYAHIGNMRTYIFNDILRKVLKYNGYNIKQVINITDVGHLVSDGDDGEDKMVKTAAAEKKTPWEIAEFYTDVFLKDIKSLNIELPELMPKVTDHIDEMISFVKVLMDKGFCYETSDGIYFDVSKFPGYGQLSRLDLEGQLAGARVEVNEEKRQAADFAVWKKAAANHIMQWPSPWGMGFPGWHIECSALAYKYLGETFDIHTGGVDAIPVHHENEIAQSDSCFGKKVVKTWLHGEFLLVDNGKMSKSIGTAYTLSDLADKGYSPLDYRYFCLNANYGSKLNFTWEGIESAKVSYKRLLEEAAKHKYAAQAVVDTSQYENEFNEAINDDLNIPKALGVVWNAVRSPQKDRNIFCFLLLADKVLSLNLNSAELKSAAGFSDKTDMPAEITNLLSERQEARTNRDFKKSDEIRDKLKSMGYLVEDSSDGQKVRPI